MVQVVNFVDTEKEVVKCLKTALSQMGVNNVRVGTKRSSVKGVEQEVIVRNTGKVMNTSVLREEEFTLYVYTVNNNENIAFEKANDLTNIVLSSLRMVVANSEFFKYVSNISSSPFEDEGETQIRSVLFTIVVQGTLKDINI